MHLPGVSPRMREHVARMSLQSVTGLTCGPLPPLRRLGRPALDALLAGPLAQLLAGLVAVMVHASVQGHVGERGLARHLPLMEAGGAGGGDDAQWGLT
jgi:hypothetical protein